MVQKEEEEVGRCGTGGGDGAWYRGRRRCVVQKEEEEEEEEEEEVTFLLQGQLPLVLYVLQRGGQVPGQTARAVGPQQRTLWGTRRTPS